MQVKSELNKLGFQYNIVTLGEAEIMEDISPEQLSLLNKGLKRSGLELIDNKKGILVEKVQTSIIELINHDSKQIKVNLSEYLSNKLDYDYTYLSNLFSEVRGATIENFYLAHKIELVKELIVYNEFNFTEIASKLHYSSVAHLSNQFKKMTGLTPSQFKKLKSKRISSLKDV